MNLNESDRPVGLRQEPRALVPEVPTDYYRRIGAIEEQHPWYRGMRTISTALLGDRLRHSERLLDVGCGTGGFIRWALDRGFCEQAVGIDVSAEAIELAAERVPGAELHEAAVWDLPLPADSFDVVVMNDVLQHVVEGRDVEGLGELRRVLRNDGALLIRTNGARRFRRENEEWCVYDRQTLAATLRRAGFHCERLTHANVVASFWSAARGSKPRAPSSERHGVPRLPNRAIGTTMYLLLRAEAGLLGRTSLSLPYGHTLFALATPASPSDTRAAIG